jgi:hypothetical protein
VAANPGQVSTTGTESCITMPHPLAILGSARSDGHTAPAPGSFLARLIDGVKCADVIDVNAVRIANNRCSRQRMSGPSTLLKVQRHRALRKTKVAILSFEFRSVQSFLLSSGASPCTNKIRIPTFARLSCGWFS